MTRFLVTIIATLFAVSLHSQTATEQINNWGKLTQAQQTKALSLVSSVFSKEVEKKVLDEFEIPLSMTYYSTDLTDKYDDLYPNSKHGYSAVSYVPLQFVESYETELQQFYEDKNVLDKVPRLTVLLAIHYTESNFIPTAVNNAGTSNPAYGMMQLTLCTAKNLYRMDEDLYDNFFSIEGEKVIFPSAKKQIEFTIKFLSEVKHYTRTYETASIRRYNGSGDEAQKYAVVVLARTRTYMQMKNKGKDIGTKQFIAEAEKSEVKDPINKQLETKGYESLTDEEYEKAVKTAIELYESDNNSSTVLPSGEKKEVKASSNNYTKFDPIPNNQCEYYLEVAKGRTLFSYFLNIKDMVKTICNEKNAKFSLFYKGKPNKKLKSEKDIDPKNNSIQTDVKVGDIIYLPSGIIIKGDSITGQSILDQKKCPK